jgi:uncharacterized protein (TIGR02646 family)
MIQIRRPAAGPASLKRLGERQTRLDCADYDLHPGAYRSGKASFPKRKYYSAKEVKALLVEIHHSKCCYCEKRFRSRANLHVEHFRPKSGFRQAPSQKGDDLPGYYWLAYNWENLLISCHDCNSVYKHTFFPLAVPARRARSHHDDVAREQPLLVDPVGQDPRDHIRFDGDLPKGITRQGRKTIKGLGLRRVELKEDRLSLLNQIDTFYTFLQLVAKHPNISELHAKAKEARKFIEAAMRPEAEFSSMVIDYVASRGL